MGERTIHLSKSKYLAGLQCHKLLWYELNAPDELPDADDSTEEVFRQGMLVGELAKKLYPDGVEIPRDHRKPRESFEPTRRSLGLSKPLFEPGFEHELAYAFVDILEPAGKDAWNIVEVKCTTEVKDIHIEDVGLQRFVCEGAGLKIKRCFVLHVNKNYVRKGEVDPKEFFIKQDVTKHVDPLSLRVRKKLDDMRRDVLLRKAPEIKIGPHCEDPYECALKGMCWSFVPDQSVFTLYRMRSKKKFELFERGILHLHEIRDDLLLNAKQRIQIDSLKNGEAHIDRRSIMAFLKRLRHPLYFLDFESYSGAIPPFDGLKPYQQVPFQFSLHVIHKDGSRPVHHSYLADGPLDSRRTFLETLVPLLGNEGSIVVFNRAFEEGVLEACCNTFREHRPWFRRIKKRIVDLLEPFRGFHYYHPQQVGSASIKAVLPAITGKDYSRLAIQDGGAASREYMRVTFQHVPPSERARVRQALEKYCELDTLGMVWILQELKKMASQ